MAHEFNRSSNRYAIKTVMEKLSSDEIAIHFKSKKEVKQFFYPAIESLMPKKTILTLAKRTAPTYCCRANRNSSHCLSDNDYLEQFYVRVASGELKIVQKSQTIRHSVDPIGWFDWDKFFSDPRVQPNFHDLPLQVQLSTIKAWQQENSPIKIVDIFKPTKFESTKSSKGTIGVGFSTTGGTGKAASGTILIVFDEAGNVGYLKSGGAGGMGGSSVSGTFIIQATNAKDIYKLKGLSSQSGGSLGEGLTVGLEYITGSGYHGVNFSFGLGTGLTPAELHSIAEYASVKGAKVDEIMAYVKNLKFQN